MPTEFRIQVVPDSRGIFPFSAPLGMRWDKLKNQALMALESLAQSDQSDLYWASMQSATG